MLKQREQPFFNLSAAYGTAKIHCWMAFLQKRYFTERSVLESPKLEAIRLSGSFLCKIIHIFQR